MRNNISSFSYGSECVQVFQKQIPLFIQLLSKYYLTSYEKVDKTKAIHSKYEIEIHLSIEKIDNDQSNIHLFPHMNNT
jgi:hypothetical protein